MITLLSGVLLLAAALLVRALEPIIAEPLRVLAWTVAILSVDRFASPAMKRLFMEHLPRIVGPSSLSLILCW
jgi:hypothetical protein